MSLLTESFFNSLSLQKNRCSLNIEGVGATTATTTRGHATIQLHSTQDNAFHIDLDVYILRSITSDTPVTYIDAHHWSHLRGLELADPSFGTPGRIDMLIGADIWGMIIQDGIIAGERGEPCALRTRLGWVVFGPTSVRERETLPLHTFTSNKCINEERLDEILRKFWEIEEATAPTAAPENICEQIFLSTHTRNADGRYIVQIPFRPDAPTLGNSHPLALRQFHQLERRLTNDPELREKYINFMREYERLGHMEAIPDQHMDPSQCYFIPHHPVTAKFRVVFNASAKTSNGISLNDTQLAGPQLQDALVHIILRFRRFEIAITGDVEKMFRQVEIDVRHRPWQQILWRESPSHPLRTYQLKTVTYGMASGPYNSIRALRQCAIDNHHVIADASRAAAARASVLDNFYVDDYLDSADSPEEAITLATDIDTILRHGQFHLRKWNSNDAQSLAAITGINTSALELELSDSDTTVLGLHWNPLTDELFYRIRVCTIDTSPTKRTVLSEVARLYDPTGMLAPVVITAKMFIQSLWHHSLDWDTPLPDALRDEWLRFSNGLHQLSQIRVPRWLGMKQAATMTLHGFCDASSRAYAAVIYLRTIDNHDQPHISLVTAKTKVAPVKALTIPRLELCAAHLLVTTFLNVRAALRLGDCAYTLWTDSTIVLCWLRKPADTLKQYVSNRIGYIQQHSEINRWRHIRTHVNPADCASRGLLPPELQHHQLWWTGPPSLLDDLGDECPTTMPLTASDGEAVASETKPPRLMLHTRVTSALMTSSDNKRIPLVERFSTLTPLLRSTAYVHRLLRDGRQYLGTTTVSTQELETALLFHIREAQGNAFKSEINALRSRSSVDATSKLLTLNPFLDGNHTLRVGGRLTNSELSYDQKHPIILPRESTLASLIIDYTHRVTLHGGIQQMLQHIRQRYWILHNRTLVKSHIHRCVQCRLHQRTMQQQQMASLPRSRVLVAPPFTRTGLDYCGPFNIRLGGRRAATMIKTYAVIFVCMCTKAVHIELAEDLSTRAFLDVFDRFVSRRGYGSDLYSDNGTRFVGADRVMRKETRAWNNEHAQQHIADAGVRWHFITPAAPHHGGLWEAAVRSAKKHLVRVVGSQTLQYHQLNTLLVRIEACLNSRPIIALRDDHTD